MANKYDHLLIDSNNLYARNYYAQENMTFSYKGNTIVTGGVHGFLRSLNRLKKLHLKENGLIWCLFDNSDSKINMRRDLYDPAYKKNRKDKPKAYYRGMDCLRLILHNYRDYIRVVYGTGFEADDIAPVIIRQFPLDSDVLACSEDLDWARLITNNIKLYMKNKVFGQTDFYEKYGFTPSEKSIILYKTIRGDKVDNIPIGLPMITTKNLNKIIENYDDIFDVLDSLDEIEYLNESWKEKFEESSARLRLNHQLVSFIPIDDEYIKDFIFTGKFRPKILEPLYEALGFQIFYIDTKTYKAVHKNQPDKFEFRQPIVKRK